jgi:hypothetical protein
MKRLAIVSVLSVLLLAFGASAALADQTTTFNPAAAPEGTHLVTGTPTPTCTVTTLSVSCNSYELAGVGNTDATATLVATYSATVQCRNRGGNIVEVHSQFIEATSTSGEISPVNGRLTIPALTSTAPTAAEFEAQATCPNPNWTAEVLASTITLESFTYTVTFEGFEGAYITIAGTDP